MEFRTLYTKLWRDEWYGNLSRAGKLLFIYCITNPAINQIGIYDVSDRVIMFDTGLNAKELEDAKQELFPKVVFYKGWVKVRNALKYSNFKGESNQKAQEKELNLVPDEILSYFNELDTLPTPSPTESIQSLSYPILSYPIQEEAKEIISYVNELWGKNFKSPNAWIDNYEKWREVYSVEDIKKALKSWADYGFIWKNKDTGKNVDIDLQLLFRTENRQGKCDYIEQLLNRRTR